MLYLFFGGVISINLNFLAVPFKKLCSRTPPSIWPNIYEQVHEISNNVVCATSKAPYQPAHMHSLIRAFFVALVFYDC